MSHSVVTAKRQPNGSGPWTRETVCGRPKRWLESTLVKGKLGGVTMNT